MNALLPVYYQIKQSIKNAIIAGEYGPGDKIPSENELAESFRVSRLTARQAIQQLIQEGFLVSRRGKGTFVTGNTGLIDSFNLEFSGFMDDLFYQISKSRTRWVHLARVTASAAIREKLGLKADETEVVQIKRVRYKDDKSFAYTVNYLPLDPGLRISKDDLLVKPLMQIMEQEFKVRFTEAFQTIEARFADQEVAEKLDIASGSPILYVERIMYGQKRKPVELVQSSYRGDIYKYIVRLKNVKSKVPNMWVHQPE